jgi:hypothetical protein
MCESVRLVGLADPSCSTLKPIYPKRSYQLPFSLDKIMDIISKHLSRRYTNLSQRSSKGHPLEPMAKEQSQPIRHDLLRL